ncbi:gamma-glutamylcyclotransferase family protein [Brevibacillus thermoruber]|uniref:gamma-glutamylcyclotransferase family protein n=1 Tax=Brevibacillus thermoruber TaxID=33942 RepID=UPI00041CE38E|nr:gamma-glutamylcyclotransferase family protein [Brevibacillus thermoruber]
MNPNRLPVFVYGSLLEGFRNWELYVKPYPHHALPAEVKGRLYHLPTGYPGLLREGEGTVKGDVLLFSPEVYDEALRGLDELETYVGPGDPRNEYEREIVTARLAVTGEERYVYVYRYVDEAYAKRTGIFLDDGDWRAFMRRRGE